MLTNHRAIHTTSYLDSGAPIDTLAEAPFAEEKMSTNATARSSDDTMKDLSQNLLYVGF
jgi:hypothetical protein